MRQGTKSDELPSLSVKNQGVTRRHLKHAPSPTWDMKSPNIWDRVKLSKSRKTVSNRKFLQARRCKSVAFCGCTTAIPHRTTKVSIQRKWDTRVGPILPRTMTKSWTLSLEFQIPASAMASDMPLKPSFLLSGPSSSTRRRGPGVSCRRTRISVTWLQKWNLSPSERLLRDKDCSFVKILLSEGHSFRIQSRDSTNSVRLRFTWGLPVHPWPMRANF